jgi:hypothetical protein
VIEATTMWVVPVAGGARVNMNPGRTTILPLTRSVSDRFELAASMAPANFDVGKGFVMTWTDEPVSVVGQAEPRREGAHHVHEHLAGGDDPGVHVAEDLERDHAVQLGPAAHELPHQAAVLGGEVLDGGRAGDGVECAAAAGGAT